MWINETNILYLYTFFFLLICIIASGLSELRNENDASCTYEGDNNVLVQQVSNWLFKLWYKRSDAHVFDTPLKSALFLTQADNIVTQRFSTGSVNCMKNSKGKISSNIFTVEMNMFQNIFKFNFFINHTSDVKYSDSNVYNDNNHWSEWVSK